MRSHSWSAVVGATGKTNARLASFFAPCLHLPTPSSALPIRETGIPLTPDTVRHLSLISGCAGSARGAGRRVSRCGLHSLFIPSTIYLPFSSARMLIDRCSHVGRSFVTSSLFSPRPIRLEAKSHMIGRAQIICFKVTIFYRRSRPSHPMLNGE